MRLNADTTITGERVVLVPYRPEHVPRYHAWMQSPELQVGRRWGWGWGCSGGEPMAGGPRPRVAAALEHRGCLAEPGALETTTTPKLPGADRVGAAQPAGGVRDVLRVAARRRQADLHPAGPGAPAGAGAGGLAARWARGRDGGRWCAAGRGGDEACNMAVAWPPGRARCTPLITPFPPPPSVQSTRSSTTLTTARQWRWRSWWQSQTAGGSWR
jgi:hypothetical protein